MKTSQDETFTERLREDLHSKMEAAFESSGYIHRPGSGNGQSLDHLMDDLEGWDRETCEKAIAGYIAGASLYDWNTVCMMVEMSFDDAEEDDQPCSVLVSVPRHRSAWTTQMAEFIEALARHYGEKQTERWVLQNVEAICASWGDENKMGQVYELLANYVDEAKLARVFPY